MTLDDLPEVSASTVAVQVQLQEIPIFGVEVLGQDAPFGGVQIDLGDSTTQVVFGGNGGGGGGGAGNLVRSVFGRIGDILALRPDYAAFYQPLDTDLTQIALHGLPWINVLDYGAVADDSTDNTAAFNNALAAAVGGQTVFVPPGSYVVNGDITVPPFRFLMGAGNFGTAIHVTWPNTQGYALINLSMGSTLKNIALQYDQPDPPLLADGVTPDYSVFHQYKPAIRIDSIPWGCTVESVRIVKAWDGIKFDGNGGRSYIRNIEMSMFNRGFDIDGPLDSVRMENIHVWPFSLTANQAKAFYLPNHSVAFYVGRCDGLHIHNLMAINGGGIDSHAGADGVSANWFISDSDFDTCASILWSAGVGFFNNCLFSSAQPPGPANNFLVVTEAAGKHSRIVISNGHFYGLATGGMVQVKAGTVQLSNCRFTSTQGDQPSIAQTAGSLQVNGSYFDRPVDDITPITYTTPFIDVTGGNAVICNNVVKDIGTGTGAFLNLTSSDPYHIVASNKAIGWSINWPASSAATIQAFGNQLSTSAGSVGQNQSLGVKQLYLEGGSAGNLRFLSGSGSPEGAVTADPGSLYLDTSSGGSGNYAKITGTGSTGWIAAGSGGGGGAVASVFGRTGAVVALTGDYAAFYQPLDSDLTSIAALTTTSYGRGFLPLADATAARTYIGAQAAGSYQPLDSDLTTWSGITPTAGIGTWIATPSSANLRAAVTDENGTGALLFSGATNPDFTTGITIGGAALAFSHLAGDFALTQTPSLAATSLMGRGSAAGAGDWERITVGSGLSLTGTVLSATAGGGGTVTDFSSGDLSPLFTTTEATTTTTPALSFVLTSAAATTVFGRAAGTSGAPTYSASPQFTAIGNLTTNGFVKTGGGVGTLSVDTATYLTANQNISLTGDVTGGPAATSIATTIGANKVTLGMMATMATDSILGRATAATGNVEVLSALPFAYTGDVTRPVDSNVTTLAAGNAGNLNSGTLLAARMPALTGDVTTTIGTVATTIANNAVTYAKMQDVTATSRFLGRITAGAGDPEELTAANAKTILALTSADVGLGSVTNAAQTLASVVPNTLPGAGQILVGNAGATAYAPVTMGTDATLASTGALTIANNAVTLAKMATMATDSILGRATASTGNVEVLSSLPFAFTGDVTRPVDSNVTTLAAGNAGNLNSGTLLAARMPAFTGDVTSSVGTVANTLVNIPATTTIAGVTGTRGDVLYYGASGWAKLGAGTSGNFLKTQGAGADPTWAAGGGGTTTFIGLTDVPASYSGANSKVVAVNAGATALEFVSAPAAGAAGSNTQVQFNDGGTVLGGDAGLTYNKTTDMLSGVQETLTFDNTDYTNTGGANAHLLLSNPNASGQNNIVSYINGAVRAKMRSDTTGNINWVAYGTGGGAGHHFFTGGDYSLGTDRVAIFHSSPEILMASTTMFGWANGVPAALAPGDIDTAIYRNAAGVVEVNNGTAGTYRDLTLRNLVANGNGNTIGDLNVRNSTAGRASFQVIPNGSVTTNPSMVRLYGTDFVADNVNFEFVSINTKGTADTFHRIISSAVGTGTVRPLSINADGTTTQLVIGTSGGLGVNTATAGGTGVVNAATGYQINGITTAGDYNNSSVSSQTPSTSDVYVAGSSVVVAAGGFNAKGQYRCLFDIVKSAGTGTIVLTLRIGTAGTTGDTSRITFTFPAGTSVADTGSMEVVVNWRTVGSGTSAVVSGFCQAFKNTVTAAGLWSNTSAAFTIVGAVSGGFNSSTATTIGLSFNGGTAFAGTITTVQATLTQ